MSSLEELLVFEVWPDFQVHTLGEDGKSSLVGRMATVGIYLVTAGSRKEMD